MAKESHAVQNVRFDISKKNHYDDFPVSYNIIIIYWKIWKMAYYEIKVYFLKLSGSQPHLRWKNFVKLQHSWKIHKCNELLYKELLIFCKQPIPLYNWTSQILQALSMAMFVLLRTKKSTKNCHSEYVFDKKYF